MQRKLLTLEMAAVISITAASMSGCENVKGVTKSLETKANTEVTTDTEKITKTNSGLVGASKENTQSVLDIENELAQVEKKAAVINNKLQNEILTQTEMNQLTSELYKLWDNELNKIWSYLKDTLDNSTMNTLKEDERNWIKEKDSQVKEAGKEAQGGTMQSMLENSTAAELTRKRVYELAKYISH